MRLLGRAVLAVAVLAFAAPAAAYAPRIPPQKTLYTDGPSGRFLLDGAWLRRLDPRDRGIRARWFAGSATGGWQGVTVPNAWNAGDNSVASMIGKPVWYRSDFRLPDAGRSLAWTVHFDSVNYRATAWLNGHQIGTHTGSYTPFELRLKGARPGINRLVVRVDNRLLPTDLPPSNYSESNDPRGGWWNYGGITRSVYLRRIDRVDLGQVRVRPRLACATCAARVEFAATVTNYSRRTQRVRVVGRYGSDTVALGGVTVAAGRSRAVSGSVAIPAPHLWSIVDPYLYTATLDAELDGQAVTRYTVLSGIRVLGIGADGRLTLNGQPVDFRGVAMHEDSLRYGNAIGPADRDAALAWAQRLGATEIRAHYPLDQYTYEQADRLGLLVWSEVPVYRMKGEFFGLPAAQRAASQTLRENILANQNHPSVIVWSVGNELNQTAPALEGAYIARAARLAKALDPTRLVGISIGGVPGSGCGPAYAPLDMLGLNDYYGWYGGATADAAGLSPYLDSVRACEPHKVLTISEFGAEANRHGPATEKGTFEFQSAFVRFHLGVYATKPWLSGATYFTLQEFRVGPFWNGGNPRPEPPFHQKGLISFAGIPKPAFDDVAAIFHATRQYPAPSP
ncbi:MAG: glycoside hydrolase family 2 TIM barrel-domain containing protein [Thermoleophilaceae bacterium]